jgi:hypothetical protein
VTECYQTSLEFPPVKRRKVEADFSNECCPGTLKNNGVGGGVPAKPETTINWLKNDPQVAFHPP